MYWVIGQVVNFPSKFKLNDALEYASILKNVWQEIKRTKKQLLVVLVSNLWLLPKMGNDTPRPSFSKSG